MKTPMLCWLVVPLAALVSISVFADITKMNGVTITTATKIDGAVRAKANGIAITAGGGGGQNFSYDFTGTDGAEWDVAKFTEASGSVNILTNQGRFVTTGFVFNAPIYTGANCSTVNQYHRLTVITVGVSNYLQYIFRYTDASSPYYTLEIDVSNGNASWYYWASLNTGSVQIGSTQDIGSLVTTNTISVTLTGTGTATVMRAWLNATGNTPDSGGALWGGAGPTLSWTDDPASAVDTGVKIGLGCYMSAVVQLVDTWFGGDIP